MSLKMSYIAQLHKVCNLKISEILIDMINEPGTNHQVGNIEG